MDKDERVEGVLEVAEPADDFVEVGEGLFLVNREAGK